MKRKNWFWGLFFIAGAILLLVERLGGLGDISTWSMLLSVLFAATLIQSLFSKSVSGVLFSLAFLSIVYAKPLGITAITPWTVLGAALLASIGASFLYHPKKNYYHQPCTDGHFEDIETVQGEHIDLSTTFASSIKYVNSDDFRQVNIHCSFGAMKVYFEQAQIQGETAAIYVDASFCGIELFIPKAWQVVDKISTSFGGVEEKNKNDSDGRPLVTLLGKVSFSEVTIFYV